MVVEHREAGGFADRVDAEHDRVDGHRADLAQSFGRSLHEPDRRVERVIELIAPGRVRSLGVCDELLEPVREVDVQRVADVVLTSIDSVTSASDFQDVLRSGVGFPGAVVALVWRTCSPSMSRLAG